MSFSSSEHQKDIESAYNLGADAYVVKPIDFEQFEQNLEGIINHWVYKSFHSMDSIQPIPQFSLYA